MEPLSARAAINNSSVVACGLAAGSQPPLVAQASSHEPPLTDEVQQPSASAVTTAPITSMDASAKVIAERVIVSPRGLAARCCVVDVKLCHAVVPKPPFAHYCFSRIVYINHAV